LFAVLFIMPLLVWQEGSRFRVRIPLAIVASSAAHVLGLLCFFAALVSAPLNEATALSFTTPLFATIGAALILGERLKFRRIAALMAGFVGILIVLRPGMAAISADSILVLASCIAFAGVSLIIKSMTSTVSATAIVFYQTLISSALCVPAAWFFWRTPDLVDLATFVAFGLLSALGWLLFTRAFALAEASSLTPYEFARLPITAVLAYLLFGEIPDEWTWAGGIVIFVSTAYIAHREAVVARAAG
jgi:drug/metabolite transporter (DMT)-like permease